MRRPLFQLLKLYETKTRFYFVASNYGENLYHVMKVDRTEVDRLCLTEDQHEYSDVELADLLAMISNSSVEKSVIDGDEMRSALVERVSFAHGLLGFIRFTAGYYMVLVTKAVPVAKIGYEIVYKVEETAMFYVPFDRSKTRSVKEQRYVKIFQSVDLSTNFYFCYTYDLSRTLQSNYLSLKAPMAERFVWNRHLLAPLLNAEISRRWILPVIHGFVRSLSFHLHCVRAQLVLIARRSSRFAGTRFLRRGANCKGDVANEVETEQIVFDKSVLSFKRGRFLSFVQLRGSAPFRWSQAITGMVSKPVIQIDAADPFAVIPALHFKDLRRRYGDPIVVVNLVKRRERFRREHLLDDEFRTAVTYLNQFLPPRQRILYLSFDLARCHKRGDALAKLEEIAHNILEFNGWFQSFQTSHCILRRQSSFPFRAICNCSRCHGLGGFSLQQGVSRTNCVDCLDRTNVAQFVVGKVALTYQLLSLGLTEGLSRKLDSEICHLLEAAYDEHGDTLALQYAGSQLVHSIKTYKKTSILQERSRDVIQTLSRYYSNAFADFDKQNAINLFLGVFLPDADGVCLWELPTPTVEPFVKPVNVDYCAWFETPPNEEANNEGETRSEVDEDHERTGRLEIDEQARDEKNSLWEASSDASYHYFYRTSDLTVFDDILSRQAFGSVSSTPGKRDAKSLSLWWKKKMQNIKEETAKTAAPKKDDEETSSDDESDSSESEIFCSSTWKSALASKKKREEGSTQCRDMPAPVSRWTVGSSDRGTVCGVTDYVVPEQDIAKYRAYVSVAMRQRPQEHANGTVGDRRTPPYTDVEFPVAVSSPSSFTVRIPVVSPESVDFYEKMVALPGKIFDAEYAARTAETYRDLAYPSYTARQSLSSYYLPPAVV